MILKPSQVFARTGLSRTTIWRLQREGRFPLPVKLSSRRVGYRDTDIDQWEAGLVA